MDINDPRTISQSDFPFHFVLSNQTTSPIAFLIDWRTKSNFDHCMQAINQGKFITQDWGGYHEIPMDGYLKKGGTLKFIRLTNTNPVFDSHFRTSILNHLTDPGYKKIYGFLQILGQTIGLKWLTFPGTYDCSQIALHMIKINSIYLPKDDSTFIMSLPNTATPDDIDNAVKNHPEIFSVYGIWSADMGVVV